MSIDMTPRRVVITGIGAVTPIGQGSSGLWDGVTRAETAVRLMERFDASHLRSRLAAEVRDWDPLVWLDRKTSKRLDRFSQFGVIAALQALRDSCLTSSPYDSSRFGVSLGSALGGIAYGEDQYHEFDRAGMRAISPHLATAVYGGAGGANIAIELGLTGPNLANANSCASGAIAIGEAVRVIQRGEADRMLAGGAEAPLAPLTYGSFSLIRAMSSRNHDPDTASRPFDRDRDGFVMAEGAAVLVLEERGMALARRARIYAEVGGYGHTNDAYHMTAPRPDGREAARAISLAMHEARVRPGGLGYINAHATGTALGDVAEARAIYRALGEAGRDVPVSGTKGMYGHALGASGAIEVAIAALALTHGFLPGTRNLFHQDENCHLNALGHDGLRADIESALTTSFGFGGSNAALVLTRPLAPVDLS